MARLTSIEIGVLRSAWKIDLTRWAAKLGGASLILGSVLLAAYATLLPILLSVPRNPIDYAQVVLSPAWVPLTLVAFAGVLLMLPGLVAVYLAVRPTAALPAAIGFVVAEVGCVLQACLISWELFLDPVIGAHPASAFLLRDAVLFSDSAVKTFRLGAAITLAIGPLLLCIALLRSREFSRLPAILIVVGMLLYVAEPIVSGLASTAGILLLAVGCCLIGARVLQAPATFVGGR